MIDPGWKRFRGESLRVAIPILLGIVPALVITNRQANLQREQLLLERRLTAIREFSAISWRGPAERIVRNIELKSRADSMPSVASIDPSRLERLIFECSGPISSFTQWACEQQSQGMITGALTGVEAPHYPSVTLSIPSGSRLAWRPLTNSGSTCDK
jgi:hypothetical protein